MLLTDFTRRLRTSKQETAAWYAVIEGAHPQFDALRLLYEFDENPQWFYVFESAHFGSIQKVSPILFKLEKPEWWLQHWQEKYPGLPGSMLMSMAPMVEVRRHLERLASVRLANQREAIFRFYDSWIMNDLYSVLNNAERQNLHGPLHQWLWWVGEALLFSDESRALPTPTYHSDESTWLTLDEEKVGAIKQGMESKRNWELGSNE
ncbi:DUF4123 domain-containing protein [Marinobacter sp.]|uniref:DUF4123 domain-containing protein n=1 Tax=Marinobacter sp. TaxID=50741 RepID=UPI001B5C9A9D|nr:DUF4123 domain-containing protein [Marinobacter sp.]MBQ0833233.1 DUF4123 domain-containing protein [Marinobacter sp.]